MSIKYLFSLPHYCNFAMMKHLYILLLSGYLLIGFAACKQHRPYNDQLAHIDSLADVNPDSADVLLIYTPSPSQKGGEKEVWELLRIKIDDKLYRPVTHYRDTILQLIDYFERHPRVLPRLLGKTGPARPYLYAGRVFADLGDAPQALDYYQRALDVMPDGQIENGECKTDNGIDSRVVKQRGLILSQIGEQFYFQGLYGNALTTFQEALRLAEQSEDTVSIIFKSRDIAEQYKFMNINDSCLYYYQAALQLAKEVGNIDRITELNSQIARFYKDQGQYHLARKYMQPAIDNFDSLNISSTYSILSDIYKNTNKFDSAYIYYNKLLQYGNIYGKCNAYKGLCELQLKKGNVESAYNYLSQYKLLDDSIRKMDNAETVARMHAAYNYQKHEKETAQLKVANAQKEKMIVISGFFIAFLVGIIYVLIYRDNQNKLRNARQQQLLRDIQRSLENEHIARKKRSNIQEDSLTAFKRTIIYKTFLLLSQTRDRNVSKKEWDDFSQEFNNYFPDFRLKLSGMFNLSTKQYRVCMLRKSGFGTTAICHLACYEKISVYSIYKRLYFQATGKKGSTADFDNLLKAL